MIVTAASVLAALPDLAGAAPTRYTYRPLAFLDTPAPGGGQFVVDFEPTNMNERGTVAFTADVSTGGEGVFLARDGELTQITRTGLPAPGGGKMGQQGELGTLGLNNNDDVIVPFFVDPPANPFGINGAVFRYTSATQSLRRVAGPGTRAPGGGTFRGALFETGLNDAGDAVFTGLVTGTDIDPNTPPGTNGIASGVYGERGGALVRVVVPGDPAPGGGVFDTARDPRINNRGDVTLGAHVAGEECIGATDFQCFESLYVRSGATGAVRSIAHQGAPAPGGGRYRVAYGGQINDRGDIAFLGDLTRAPAVLQSIGVFLNTGGVTRPVVRPGRLMPGGGHAVSAGRQPPTIGLDGNGNVGFVVSLNTDVDADEFPDTGAYIYQRTTRTYQLVARTGTVIPGFGTIAHIGVAEASPITPVATGGMINTRGQMLLSAELTDGRTVLLRASPAGIDGA